MWRTLALGDAATKSSPEHWPRECPEALKDYRVDFHYFEADGVRFLAAEMLSRAELITNLAYS